MPPSNLPIDPLRYRQPKKRSSALGIIACIVCLLFIAGIFFFSVREKGTDAPPPDALATTTPDLSYQKAFDDLSLEAKSVYVFDVRNDMALYVRGTGAPWPLASITKLLTGLVAATSLPADTVVTITSDALATEGESGLMSGEMWDLQELIAFMLVTSSNDAATALRRAYENATGGSFISAMNTEASRIGMLRSHFSNEHGLDTAGQPSNLGSPEDVARLLIAVNRTLPEALDATRHESVTFISESEFVHNVHNTNELADTIPWSVGAKTGFTDSAGGNLAISFDASIGRPMVIVVLGSSREGRFIDMEKLVEATLASVPYL